MTRPFTLTRMVWLAAGCACVGLGGLGLVLPVLPTTPFLLLAAACFARSSKRLHHWLLAHRVWGPLLRDWEAHRSIPRRAKVLATTLIILSVAFGMVSGRLRGGPLLATAALLGVGLAFVWTRPDGPHTKIRAPDR